MADLEGEDELIARARRMAKDETYSSSAIFTEALKSVQERAPALEIDDDVLFAQLERKESLSRLAEKNSKSDDAATAQEIEKAKEQVAKRGAVHQMTPAEAMATLTAFLKKTQGPDQNRGQGSKSKDPWHLTTSTLPPTFCPPPITPDPFPFLKPPPTGSLDSIAFAHSSSYALDIQMIVEQAVLTAALLKEAWHPTRLLAQKACEAKQSILNAARTLAVSSAFALGNPPLPSRTTADDSNKQTSTPGADNSRNSAPSASGAVGSTSSSSPASGTNQGPLPLQRSFRLGIIGCGRVGSLILRALLERGVIPPTRILVATRKPSNQHDQFRCLDVEFTTDVMQVVTTCNFIILAVAPHQMAGLLSQIAAEPSVFRTNIELMLSRVTPSDPSVALSESATARRSEEEEDSYHAALDFRECTSTQLLTIVPPLDSSESASSGTVDSEEKNGGTSLCPQPPAILCNPYELYKRWRNHTSLVGGKGPAPPLPFTRQLSEAAASTSESVPLYFSVCAGVSTQRLHALLHTPLVMRSLVPIPHAHLGLNHYYHSTQIALRHLLVGVALHQVRKQLRFEIARCLERVSTPSYLLFPDLPSPVDLSPEATDALGHESAGASTVPGKHRSNLSPLMEYIASTGNDLLFGAGEQLDLVLDRSIKVVQEAYLPSGLPLLRAYLNDPYGTKPPFPLESKNPSFATCHAVPGTFGTVGVPFT